MKLSDLPPEHSPAAMAALCGVIAVSGIAGFIGWGPHPIGYVLASALALVGLYGLIHSLREMD